MLQLGVYVTSDSRHKGPVGREVRTVKILERAERRGRGHSLVVPSGPSAVRMRAAVEGRNFLGAAQGCSADDDKGIAAAVI